MRITRSTGDRIAWVAVFLFTLIYLLPLAWVALGAFKTRAEMFATPPILFPSQLNLDNFRQVLTNSPELWNSIVISTVSTALVLLLALPAAYAFTRFRLRRGSDLQFWILSTRMMPPIAVIIPVFVIFQNLRLFDTRLGMILVYTAFNLPFAVWMLAAAFRQVPLEIEEAARVDGSTLFQTITRISIPLARSGVAVAAIFAFIWAWNDLLFGLVLTASDAKTFPVSLSEYTGQVNIQWELMAATSVIQALPVLLLTFLVQRHIVSGLTFGGVER
ncbi:MAG: carbohydrate ABC transporter permease [Thermomicrobiales bacterium]